MKGLDVLYTYDYIGAIIQRLTAKRQYLNVSQISRDTGVSRAIISSLMNGERVNTSFENVVTLYKFLDDNRI